MSTVAAQTCPECGLPAYIGMNNVECVHPGCRNYDAATEEAHHLEVSGSPQEQPKIAGPFRDFCRECHVPVDFERWKYPDGSLSAWCPHCGQPNYWGSKTADFGDEDTDPQYTFTTKGYNSLVCGSPKYADIFSDDKHSIDKVILDYLDQHIDKASD